MERKYSQQANLYSKYQHKKIAYFITILMKWKEPVVAWSELLNMSAHRCSVLKCEQGPKVKAITVPAWSVAKG